MKLIKVLASIIPVIKELLEALADGKISPVERDALLASAGLKVAEVIGVVLEK